MKDLYYKLALDWDCSDTEFWLGTITFVPINWREFKLDDMTAVTAEVYNGFCKAINNERDSDLCFSNGMFPGSDNVCWDYMLQFSWEMNTDEEKPESIFDSRADINPNDLLQYLKGLGFNLIENAAEVDEFNAYHLELSNAYFNYKNRNDSRDDR